MVEGQPSQMKGRAMLRVPRCDIVAVFILGVASQFNRVSLDSHLGHMR